MPSENAASLAAAASIYRGEGQRLKDRGGALPPYVERPRGEERYDPDTGLLQAANVALALGQPLLLTGAPGTGKTEFAFSLSWELDLPLEIFHAKTTSVARDLFYRYDSLRHFHAVHTRKEQSAPVENFIEFAALGRAILRASDTEAARVWVRRMDKLAADAAVVPKRSVVLIDEIDKAPRDLPNDVLNEFERMEFAIEELAERQEHRAQAEFRPILILTSNSEKNLPDAFLRRCVYYHIPTPDKQRLNLILRKRLGERPGVTPALIREAAELFEEEIRTRMGPVLKKPPATAECLAWVEVLAAQGIDLKKADHHERLLATFCILAKTEDDLKRLREKTAADFESLRERLRALPAEA